MNVNVNLNDVEDFINNDKFTQFLLNNNTDIAVPAFILSVLYDKIDELKKEGTE